MQTSLDGDHRDRHGSKHPKTMPGLDWTHRNKRDVGSRKERYKDLMGSRGELCDLCPEMYPWVRRTITSPRSQCIN